MEDFLKPVYDAFYIFPARVVSFDETLAIPTLLSAFLVAALFLVFRRGLKNKRASKR
jgi:hypothetical protein